MAARVGEGPARLQAAALQGAEGLMAKRAASLRTEIQKASNAPYAGEGAPGPSPISGEASPTGYGAGKSAEANSALSNIGMLGGLVSPAVGMMTGAMRAASQFAPPYAPYAFQETL